MKSIPLPSSGTGRQGTCRRGQGARDQRGGVRAPVGISLTTLVGFMVLSTAVGHTYHVRADATALPGAVLTSQTRSNLISYRMCPAKMDTRTVEAEARAGGVRIHVIDVGGNADPEWMKQIADGNYRAAEPYLRGQVVGHLHADGRVASDQQQLQNISKKLGGERPVIRVG